MNGIEPNPKNHWGEELPLHWDRPNAKSIQSLSVGAMPHAVGELISVILPDPHPHVVVTKADPVICIDASLLETVNDPNRNRIPGDMEIDDDIISLGTPGQGLGAMTYKLRESLDNSGVPCVVGELMEIDNER